MEALKVIEFKNKGFVFTIVGERLIVTLRLGFDEVTIYEGPWRDLSPPPDWVNALWEGLELLGLNRYLINWSTQPRRTRNAL